jgi:hypothetical protein
MSIISYFYSKADIINPNVLSALTPTQDHEQLHRQTLAQRVRRERERRERASTCVIYFLFQS